jgi:hypothetical protein
MVEGARLRTGRKDELKHRVHVAQHVARSNAHDPKTFALKRCVPRRIAPGLVPVRVPLPIDLNGKPLFEARKINRDWPKWKLPPELKSAHPFAQLLPKQHFRQAHLPPQLACSPYLLDRCA